MRCASCRWAIGESPAGGGQAKKANKAWSIELCGGTHVKRTGDIGLVRVVAEAASAAGVRRIEALTGQGARAYLAEQDARVREVAGVLRTRPEEVVDRVKELLEERKQLERELANAKRQLALEWRRRDRQRGGRGGGAGRAHGRQGQVHGAGGARAWSPRTCAAWSTTARPSSAPAWWPSSG